MILSFPHFLDVVYLFHAQTGKDQDKLRLPAVRQRKPEMGRPLPGMPGLEYDGRNRDVPGAC